MSDKQKSIVWLVGFVVILAVFFALSFASFGQYATVSAGFGAMESLPDGKTGLASADIPKVEVLGTVVNVLISIGTGALLWFAKILQIIGAGLEGLVSGKKSTASGDTDQPDDVQDAFWTILEHAIGSKNKEQIANAVNSLCGEKVV